MKQATTKRRFEMSQRRGYKMGDFEKSQAKDALRKNRLAKKDPISTEDRFFLEVPFEEKDLVEKRIAAIENGTYNFKS